MAKPGNKGCTHWCKVDSHKELCHTDNIVWGPELRALKVTVSCYDSNFDAPPGSWCMLVCTKIKVNKKSRGKGW